MAMETMLSVLYLVQEHVAVSSRLWTVSESICEFTMFRRTGLDRAGQLHTRVTLYPSNVARKLSKDESAKPAHFNNVLVLTISLSCSRSYCMRRDLIDFHLV
jgi:hypothetical protein